MTHAKYYKLDIIIRCGYILLTTGMCLQMQCFKAFDKQPLSINLLRLSKVNISLQDPVAVVSGRQNRGTDFLPHFVGYLIENQVSQVLLS